MAMAAAPPIVETILITGLPGSGRSTLVSSLLGSLPFGSRCAVCVHRHAKAFTLETTALPVADPPCAHYSEVYDFGSGCLCCSPDGDLSRLLADLRSRQDELLLTHMLVETTGAADPTPFVKLFHQDIVREAFDLIGVVCVVDIIRGPWLLQDALAEVGPTHAMRGAAQLRISDAVVLNDAAGGIEASQARAACEMVVSIAVSTTPKKAASPREPAVLPAPCCSSATYEELRLSLRGLNGQLRHSEALADTEEVRPPPSPFFTLAFGPGGSGHDASCETACLVRPFGGVGLDAALAMLQALLDTGDAFRVQGYLSYLPSTADPSYPPPLERCWALPMVVVDGEYRGRLRVRGVELVLPPNFARSNEGCSTPWQETAFSAAAMDRGACKVFVCGRNIDEAVLRAQFVRTACCGFHGPVCDIDQIFPAAARECEALGAAVAAAMDGGLDVDLDAPTHPSADGGGGAQDAASLLTPSRSFAEELRRAEAFSGALAAALRRRIGDVAALRAAPARSEALEASVGVPAHPPGGPSERAVLCWASGEVSLRPPASDPAAGLRPTFGEAGPLVRLPGTASAGTLQVHVAGRHVFWRRAP